jgi:hypothetical protein
LVGAVDDKPKHQCFVLATLMAHIRFNCYAVVQIVDPDGKKRFASGMFHEDHMAAEQAKELWLMDGLVTLGPCWYFKSRTGELLEGKLFGPRCGWGDPDVPDKDRAWHKHVKPGEPVCKNLATAIRRFDTNKQHAVVVANSQLAYTLPGGGMARLNMANQHKTWEFVV